MPIEVKCGKCGKGLKAPDNMAGKKAKCPSCATVLIVPAPVEEIVDAEIIEPVAAPAGNPFGLADLLEQEQGYRVQEPAPEAVSSESRRPCPMCGEMIAIGAAKCRFCGEIFDAALRRKAGETNPEAVRKFRREMHGLGGFWIFIGAVCVLVGMVLFSQRPGGGPEIPGIEGVMGGIVLFLGLVWLAIGIFVCLKHLWAVYVGLVLSYLSLIGNLLSFNIIGIAMLIAAIVQAHRCISAAGKLRKAGIALTTKP